MVTGKTAAAFTSTFFCPHLTAAVTKTYAQQHPMLSNILKTKLEAIDAECEAVTRQEIQKLLESAIYDGSRFRVPSFKEAGAIWLRMIKIKERKFAEEIARVLSVQSATLRRKDVATIKVVIERIFADKCYLERMTSLLESVGRKASRYGVLFDPQAHRTDISESAYRAGAMNALRQARKTIIAELELHSSANPPDFVRAISRGWAYFLAHPFRFIGGAILLVIISWLLSGVGLSELTLRKSTESSSKAERAIAVRSLVTDLERVKALVPVDQTFADCLTRRPPPLNSAIEACARERKSALADPLQILDRHIITLRLVFDGDVLADLEGTLRAMRYLVYEMQNNQIILEKWLHNGCGRGIKLIPTLDPDVKGSVRCTLSVENFSDFLKRSEGNTDRISTEVTRSIDKDRVKVFIVEGDQDTIDGYFLKTNNMLYTKLEQLCDSLVMKLKPYYLA